MKVNDISIVDYLQKRGVETRKEGRFYLASSPFSKDTTWSFVVYPTNTFYDWSTGFGGGITQLHSRFEGLTKEEAYKDLKTKENYDKAQPKSYKKKEFKLERYVAQCSDDIKAIKEYAFSRGIIEGYQPSIFREKKNGQWQEVLAVGFVHVDKDLKPCGIKLRRITKEEPRFSARGSLGFYVQESSGNVELEKEMVYVVEGEANANSLARHLRKLSRKAFIISYGGVTRCLGQMPEKLQKLSKKLIIDYDGNEELYQERLKIYKGLDAEPIKLILPKGEDLNSLFMKDKMYLIENLL